VLLAGNEWTETDVSWDTKPAVIGTPVADVGAIAVGTWVDYDVTSLVTGNGTFTFSLVGDVNNTAIFNSRNHDQNQPQLVISFAPIGPTATPTMTSTPEPGLAAGYRDFSYSGAKSAPTEKEGQSKVWFAGGSWWGSLYRSALGGFYIYKLDLGSQTWSPTGTMIDPRASARVDAFWDAETGKLYTVAGSYQSGSGGVVVRRFSFNGSSYTLDSGFPTTLFSGLTEDGVATINKDGAGVLWVSFVPLFGDPQPYVTHTNGSDTSWVAPYVIPVAGTSLNEDDISSVVAFGGNIGVMWSNQNDGTMYFAWHAPGADDATWTGEIAYSRAQGSDDHISLKVDSTGQVYAATKTSLNAGSDPLIVLSVRSTGGTWSNYTVSTAAAAQTRPVVVINEAAGLVQVFAAAPQYTGGKIYMKQSSLASINFGSGAGTAVIDSSLDTTINNVSSTKQIISGGMGVLIIAGDDNTTRYLHNWLP
jgi:hypothetical protein